MERTSPSPAAPLGTEDLFTLNKRKKISKGTTGKEGKKRGKGKMGEEGRERGEGRRRQTVEGHDTKKKDGGPPEERRVS